MLMNSSLLLLPILDEQTFSKVSNKQLSTQCSAFLSDWSDAALSTDYSFMVEFFFFFHLRIFSQQRTIHEPSAFHFRPAILSYFLFYERDHALVGKLIIFQMIEIKEVWIIAISGGTGFIYNHNHLTLSFKAIETKGLGM